MKYHRPTREIKVTLGESVLQFLRSIKVGREQWGDTIQRVFHDLCRMEDTYRSILEDLKRKVYSPTLFQASVTSRMNLHLRDPFKWARIGCHGISQLDVDFMRKLFPHVISGHDFINEAKVHLFFLAAYESFLR